MFKHRHGSGAWTVAIRPNHSPTGNDRVGVVEWAVPMSPTHRPERSSSFESMTAVLVENGQAKLFGPNRRTAHRDDSAD